MEVRQLRYFVTIVEQGSFTRAAETLYIAQPSLSQQMASLEQELGVKLLVRSVRGVSPTSSGKVFYRQANLILKHIDAAPDLVKGPDSIPSGRVSIGLPFSIASILAMPVLEAVAESYPRIQLLLNENPSAYLTELVMNGRLDMSILTHETHDDFHSKNLVRESLYFAGSPDASIFKSTNAEIQLAEVSRYPLMLSGRSNSSRVLIEKAMMRAGLEIEVLAEFESSRLLQMAAARRLGFIIQPLSAIQLELEAGILGAAKIVSPELSRTVSLYTAPHHTLSHAALCVHDTLIEVSKKLIHDGVWKGVALI